MSQDTLLYPCSSSSHCDPGVKAVPVFSVVCRRHGHWGTRKHLKAQVRQSRTVGAGLEPRLPVSLPATLERPCPGGVPGNGPGSNFPDPFWSLPPFSDEGFQAEDLGFFFRSFWKTMHTLGFF